MNYSQTCARRRAFRLCLVPVACALPALLTGCGSSSGSSTPNTTATAAAITAQNASQATGAVYQGVDGLTSTGSSAASGVVGAVVADGGPKSSSITKFLVHQIMHIATLDASSAASVAVGTVIPLVPSTSCDVPSGGGTAGTYKIDWNDADNSNSITAADTFDITFSKCYSSTDKQTVDGKITLSKMTVSGVATPGTTSTTYSLDATVALSTLSMTDASGTETLNGQFELTNKSQDGGVNVQETITGSSLSDASSKVTLTIENFSLAGTDNTNTQTYSYSGKGRMNDSALSGYIDFQISTSSPFTGSDNDAYPSQGKMTVTGANNSSVTLTAVDNTTVALAVDSNGDGQVDSTSNVAWSTILP